MQIPLPLPNERTSEPDSPQSIEDQDTIRDVLEYLESVQDKADERVKRWLEELDKRVERLKP